MGTIWLKDFKSGLDTRRMPEALPGGSAIRAVDGHISRGGEFEQRAAFVKEYALPAGKTVGLAYGKSGICVFGHEAPPVMPKGVAYVQLQHPDGSTPLYRILSFDLFASKVYAVAEFGDGSIYHFYDGVRVTDWQDGRARAAFRVVGGGLQAPISATTNFTITGGSLGSPNTLRPFVDGVSLTAAPVPHTGNNATTATAIATAINSFASTPEYTATALGATVTLIATPGVAANGRTPTLTMTGDVDAIGLANFVGGVDAEYSELTDLKVNGVSVINAPIVWRESHIATATAIVEAINSFSSTPDYVATLVGDKVNLIAADPGIGPNGYAVVLTTAHSLGLMPNSGITLTGGQAPGVVFQSGTFAKTVGAKVYVASGPNLHFSGIKIPTGFQSSNTGAGFIDMSTEANGSEQLQAIAKYQQYIAVFAGRTVQIWYVDPDPLLNKQAQVLNNMGTLSPRSVTQFGDNDLFFLDESGVRSLRARDSSNAASTTDVGIPVDKPIIAKLRMLSTVERSEVGGLIEPSDGRFWLVFPDEIFVFSFFEGSKISAWSTYTPAINNEPFTIDENLVYKKKVYLRSGDDILVYGGLGIEPAFDGTEPEMWTPYLDANAPARKKDFNGLDIACEGQWVISAGLNPKDLGATDKIAIVTDTTYSDEKIPFEAASTHVSLRFKGVGAGAKRIAAAAIHFKGQLAED